MEIGSLPLPTYSISNSLRLVFFGYRQKEGREGGKENRGSGGKGDRESPNQACHLIIASILLLSLHSLINFSGLELLG